MSYFWNYLQEDQLFPLGLEVTVWLSRTFLPPLYCLPHCKQYHVMNTTGFFFLSFLLLPRVWFLPVLIFLLYFLFSSLSWSIIIHITLRVKKFNEEMTNSIILGNTFYMSVWIVLNMKLKFTLLPGVRMILPINRLVLWAVTWLQHTAMSISVSNPAIRAAFLSLSQNIFATGRMQVSLRKTQTIKDILTFLEMLLHRHFAWSLYT